MKKEKSQNNKTILEIKEDQDFQEKIKSNKDLKDALTPTGRRAGQSGRAMSDKDMSYFYDSDLDAN